MPARRLQCSPGFGKFASITAASHTPGRARSPWGLWHLEGLSDFQRGLVPPLSCSGAWLVAPEGTWILRISLKCLWRIPCPRLGCWGCDPTCKTSTPKAEGGRRVFVPSRPFSWPWGMSFLPVKNEEPWKWCCWGVPRFWQALCTFHIPQLHPAPGLIFLLKIHSAGMEFNFSLLKQTWVGTRSWEDKQGLSVCPGKWIQSQGSSSRGCHVYLPLC